MEYREFEGNHAIICGTIHGEFSFSHEAYGEKFYETTMDVERLSGKVDSVPIMVSGRLVDADKSWSGKKFEINGDIRSYNKWENEKRHLILNVFARYFMECLDLEQDDNEITLDGYICKEPRYRETPLGREIADFLLAVNRKYSKCDYIPCICWGRNAKFADGILNVGDRIRVKGRIQSREYKKPGLNGEYCTKTAYEVSVGSMEVVADGESNENC